MKNENILTPDTKSAALKLLSSTMQINKYDSIYKVEFYFNQYGHRGLELVITHNDSYSDRQNFEYKLDENAENKYSLETLIKLLEEILKTNVKYKDLTNESKYDIDAFLENELENTSEFQEVCNDK